MTSNAKKLEIGWGVQKKPECFGTQKSEGKCGRCPWENLCGAPHDGTYYENLGYDLREE